MSADNGTYILQTYGPEYRIAHTQAIDNIYSKFDELTSTYQPDIDVIIECFGTSKVYTQVEDAWDAAFNLDEEHSWSEYGVCLISDFSDQKFSDFEALYATQNK